MAKKTLTSPEVKVYTLSAHDVIATSSPVAGTTPSATLKSLNEVSFDYSSGSKKVW